MLIAMNSLVAVQTNPTTGSTKQITQFLYYNTTHPDAVIEYRRSGMIIHIYLDAFYISEPDAQSIASELFY